MGYSAATGAKHVNVLQHLMGFLKNYLSREDKAYLTVGLPYGRVTAGRCTCGRLELLGLIEETRQGLVALIVPLT